MRNAVYVLPGYDRQSKTFPPVDSRFIDIVPAHVTAALPRQKISTSTYYRMVINREIERTAYRSDTYCVFEIPVHIHEITGRPLIADGPCYEDLHEFMDIYRSYGYCVAYGQNRYNPNYMDLTISWNQRENYCGCGYT